MHFISREKNKILIHYIHEMLEELNIAEYFHSWEDSVSILSSLAKIRPPVIQYW